MLNRFVGGLLVWGLVLFAPFAADAQEIVVGNLNTLDHQVAGEVVIINDHVLEIRNFVYDGQGPDAFVWIDQGPTASAAGKILYDASNCGEEVLAQYSGTTLRVEFPEGSTVSDYAGGALSIWCRQFNANFGDIVLPATLDSLPAATELQCSSAPAVQEEIVVGNLNTLDHQVAGEVVIINDRVLEIRNFVYDGQGPDAFVWIDMGPTASAAGKILYDASNCGEVVLAQSTGGTLRVEFPEGSTVSDYAGGALSIWCRQFNANFGDIVLPATLDSLPAATELQCSSPPAPAQGEIVVGNLNTLDHQVAGEVVIINDHVLEIRNFVYDGQGPDAFVWIDMGPTASAAGKILHDASNCGEVVLAQSTGGTLRVEFPEGSTVSDYAGGALSIWCRQFNANFGDIVLPATLDSLPAATDLQCSSAPAVQEEIVVGNLNTLDHQVAGEVVIINDHVLEIRNFVYDGQGPDAFVWIDMGAVASSAGKILYDASNCGEVVLAQSTGGTLRVEFPAGSSVSDYAGGALSIWCRQFNANFGDIVLPADLDGLLPATELQCSSVAAPEEIVVGNLNTLDHQVAGEVVIINDNVLEIRDFFYDGLGPDAFVWIDEGPTASSAGKILYDADNCGEQVLREYMGGETLRIEFPEGSTVSDYAGGALSIWCRQFSANFGDIILPSLDELASLMPATELQCADVSPPSGPSDEDTAITVTPANMNCEPLNDNFQVRWAVEGDVVAFELISTIEQGEYMAFGLSGSQDVTLMDGGDPVICDRSGGDGMNEFRAQDFTLQSRSQCAAGGSGVCPDTEQENGTNDVVADSVSGEEDSGLMLIRYKKPIAGSDAAVNDVEVDQTFSVAAGQMTQVIWAIGNVNPVGFPLIHTARGGLAVDFGRAVVDNCEPLGATEDEVIDAFEVPSIVGTTEFTANIGPSAGARGYQAITGRAPWGIAWYMNDLLIPVIELRRGTTYTFKVNGGNDPDNGTRNHPFYIAKGDKGGYAQLTPEERAAEEPLAGVTVVETDANGGVTDFAFTAVAPICSYETTAESAGPLATGTFAEFFRTLDTSCKTEQSVVDGAVELTFTPDETTPDEIFYHCATHRDLGWKMMVIDAEAESPMTESPMADGSSASTVTMAAASVVLGLATSIFM